MSVILHVMRKDLRRLWLPLALLAACGLTALTLSGTGLSAHPELARVLFFTAAFFFLLGMVTIGWLVQEDSARDTNAFWRSRPITPGCLITAKLALIGGAVALSIALIHFAGGGLTSKEARMMVCILASTSLACVAVAAVTRNLGEYLLIGALFAVSSDAIAGLLRILFPSALPVTRTLNDSHSLISAAIWILLSAAALVAQYRIHRTSLSVALLGAAVLGTAITKVTWTWRFI